MLRIRVGIKPRQFLGINADVLQENTGRCVDKLELVRVAEAAELIGGRYHSWNAQLPSLPRPFSRQ
jgi:hypothetical protein